MQIYKEFDWKAQSLFSRKQFNEHIKLYEGYWYNVTEDSRNSSDINGVILHEMFFNQLANLNNLRLEIDDDYDWYRYFAINALLCRGWVLYGVEKLTGERMFMVLDRHDVWLPIGFKIEFVFDCYEHAYFMDYGADKKAYVQAFINLLKDKEQKNESTDNEV